MLNDEALSFYCFVLLWSTLSMLCRPNFYIIFNDDFLILKQWIHSLHGRREVEWGTRHDTWGIRHEAMRHEIWSIKHKAWGTRHDACKRVPKLIEMVFKYSPAVIEIHNVVWCEPLITECLPLSHWGSHCKLFMTGNNSSICFWVNYCRIERNKMRPKKNNALPNFMFH